MKKFLILVLGLIIGNIALASNSLQQQYEAENIQDTSTTIYNFLYLLNEDYNHYYNGGGSLYGVIQYQIEEKEKNNSSDKSLIFLKNASKMYKQAYDTQSPKPMQYIYISDEDYVSIDDTVKSVIKGYNFIYALSQRNAKNVDLNALYEELNIDKQKFSNYKNNMSQNQKLELKYDEKHQKIEEYIKSLSENDSELIKKYRKLSEEYENFASEIFKYSMAYEKKKYENWLVKNNKKLVKGALEQYVYANQYQPQIGGLYTHDPQKNIYLIVQQTVPGGVILTGSHRVGAGIYPVGSIFLQTTKQFADGAMINEPIVAEYKGFYDYTTVLGAKKRIYKFYRYGTNEINANFSKIPGEKFYFYGFDGKWY